jgi:hypothetical protein
MFVPPLCPCLHRPITRPSVAKISNPRRRHPEQIVYPDCPPSCGADLYDLPGQTIKEKTSLGEISVSHPYRGEPGSSVLDPKALMSQRDVMSMTVRHDKSAH